MHLILLVVGVMLAAAGAIMMRNALPEVQEVGGAALFTSGMLAGVGGLILMAQAIAVRSLARIAERLYIQPLPLPPVAAVERDDPSPRPVRPGPAEAAGAARPSLLGWLGRTSTPTTVNAPRTPPLRAASAPDPAPPPVDLAPLTRLPEPPPAKPAPKPAPAATAESTVYRSGVIDGMAYTLFMDGSIQAELPQGTVKFASVDELQKYLVGKG